MMWLKTITGSVGVWDKLSYENFVPFHQLGLKEDPLLFIYIHIYICCCFVFLKKLIILGKNMKKFSLTFVLTSCQDMFGES